MRYLCLVCGLVCALGCHCSLSTATAQGVEVIKPSTADRSYSPPAERNYPQDVFWGDTHLHTNISNDAFAMGNQVLAPDEAYRFAKGEPVVSHGGMTARLRRPLDFLVVSDHAVNMGVMVRLLKFDPLLLRTETGKKWAQLLASSYVDTRRILNGTEQEYRDRFQLIFRNPGKERTFWRYFTEPQMKDVRFRKSVWEEVIANAERHNDPGKFTAFVGYEWTQGGALHRVVVFKDGKDKAGQVIPFSRHESNDPEDLWAYLQNYADQTGGDAIAIPHNANLSGGRMFALQNHVGDPFTVDYAKRRAYWEPINEVTQIKGDGEAFPQLSPDDEFADYETWQGWAGVSTQGIVMDKDYVQSKQGAYARSALKLGLDQHAKLGVNPFKFGMIGSTDSHTSLSAVDENNFWGKQTYTEPTIFRTMILNYYAASGYAAVWAEENTRDSIFAAMRRRETYATTGPRMTVRLFAGWEFDEDDAFSPDLPRIGYSKGVPMGGDLTAAPGGASPQLLIRAVKDPDGANLDRVQVIKGWRSADGQMHEKVFDVAVSDGRTIPVDGGKVDPVGSTVDLDGPSYSNTIGDPELATLWTDPEFDPEELAFYYVRVIEIPTPRWVAFDRKFFQLTAADVEGLSQETQERAYTSPIWYTP